MRTLEPEAGRRPVRFLRRTPRDERLETNACSGLARKFAHVCGVRTRLLLRGMQARARRRRRRLRLVPSGRELQRVEAATGRSQQPARDRHGRRHPEAHSGKDQDARALQRGRVRASAPPRLRVALAVVFLDRAAISSASSSRTAGSTSVGARVCGQLRLGVGSRRVAVSRPVLTWFGTSPVARARLCAVVRSPRCLLRRRSHRDRRRVVSWAQRKLRCRTGWVRIDSFRPAVHRERGRHWSADTAV